MPKLTDARSPFKEATVPESTKDLEILLSDDALTGDRQQALSRILSRLASEPRQGRPFILSPGEIRSAINKAEGGKEVLNYEHPLLPDPVVSCASKQQLIDNLRHRFGVEVP